MCGVTNRNGEIEWWRFILSLIIEDFHFRGTNFFPYGRIGVEYFFLLSGYLLAASAMKKTVACDDSSWQNINSETFALVIRRVRAFFPETLIACLVACCVFGLVEQPEYHTYIRSVVATLLGDACFMSMSGVFAWGYNVVTWYLSTLMMGSCILYPIVRRWGIPPLFFVIGVLMLGYIYINGRYVDFTNVRENFGIYKGNIRGIAEMFIGASLYPVTLAFKNITLTKKGSIFLTLIKWGMCISLLGYAHRAPFLGYNVGFALMILCGMIILCFSEKCFDNHWYQHPFILFLGKFSFPLYLSHFFLCGRSAKTFTE